MARETSFGPGDHGTKREQYTQIKSENQAGPAWSRPELVTFRFSWYHPLVYLGFDLPPAGSRTFDVAGFGLNSVDLLAVVASYPQPNTKQPIRKLARLPGGQAATAMVTCSRLGWRARYIGRFGDDDNGRYGRESLEAEGVDMSACQDVTGASNGFAIILVDAQTGERTIMWERHPGLAMSPTDVPRDAVISARVLLVDCHETEAATQAARYAREAAMPTVIDVERVRGGIDNLLRQMDVIIAAQAFPLELTGHRDLGRALMVMAEEFRPALVCVTLGAEGSLTVARGKEIRTPGFRVPVVDTTGAGDVFRGGFVAGWLAGGRDSTVEEVLTYANAVAALKCRALGAREGTPRPHEVEELLRTR